MNVKFNPESALNNYRTRFKSVPQLVPEILFID